LIGYLLWYDRKHRTDLLKTPVDIDLGRIKQLIALGMPAALQFTLESGVFAAVTALIARLGAVPLATHQIALNTVAFTYMVPLGISSAAAVRVGRPWEGVTCKAPGTPEEPLSSSERRL
jgi:MATE family multidrug resistance protein